MAQEDFDLAAALRNVHPAGTRRRSGEVAPADPGGALQEKKLRKSVRDSIMSRFSELARHLTAPEERELASHLQWFITLPDAERAKILADLERLESEEDPKQVKTKLAEGLIARLERLATNPWSEVGLLEEVARRFTSRFPLPLIQAVFYDPERRKRFEQMVDQRLFERSMEEVSKRAGFIVDVCRCGRVLAEASDEWAGLVDPLGAPIGPSAEEAAKKALRALEELRLVYAATEPGEKGREVLAGICYSFHKLRKTDSSGQSRMQIEGIGMGGLEKRDLAHDAFLAYLETGRGKIREQYVLSGKPAEFQGYLMRVMKNAGIDAYREEQRQAGAVPSRGQSKAAAEQDKQERLKAAADSIRIRRADGTVDLERTQAERERWLEKKRSEGHKRPEGGRVGRSRRIEPPRPVPTNPERGHDAGSANPLEEVLPKSLQTGGWWINREAMGAILDKLTEELHLQPRDQEILRLRLVEEMTDKEIGQRVGLARETVNRTRHRLIEKLRKVPNWAQILSLYGEERPMP
jgi:RNA polymerase sigma factor (sigma-70 family)